MSTPSDPPDDPLPPAERELTQEEFQAWLLEDPGRGEALLELMHEQLRAKLGELPPDEAEGMQRLARKFESEMADFLLPERYNLLVDRLTVLLAQELFTEEEVDELEAAEETLRQLVDMALHLPEPRRTEVMRPLLECENQVRTLLQELEEP